MLSGWPEGASNIPEETCIIGVRMQHSGWLTGNREWNREFSVRWHSPEGDEAGGLSSIVLREQVTPTRSCGMVDILVYPSDGIQGIATGRPYFTNAERVYMNSRLITGIRV